MQRCVRRASMRFHSVTCVRAAVRSASPVHVERKKKKKEKKKQEILVHGIPGMEVVSGNCCKNKILGYL